MTRDADNRTTELLREGLTERGIEWRSGLEGVTFVGDWCFVEYDNGKLAATCEPVLTPEQAIAATLESDVSAVRLAEKLRVIAEEMRNVGASSMNPHELLACYAAEVDKVADLLKFAATLGAGECEMETDWDYLTDGIPDAPEDTWAYMCSSCDWSFRYDRGIKPSYCPNCGKAVTR